MIDKNTSPNEINISCGLFKHVLYPQIVNLGETSGIRSLACPKGFPPSISMNVDIISSKSRVYLGKVSRLNFLEKESSQNV